MLTVTIGTAMHLDAPGVDPAAGPVRQARTDHHCDAALMARFFFVQEPDGYRIEVLQRHGRYK